MNVDVVLTAISIVSFLGLIAAWVVAPLRVPSPVVVVVTEGAHPVASAA